MTSYDKLFIGGHWVAPAGSEVIEVRSPHDQSLVGTVPHATPADVDAAVAAARDAFDDGPWPRLTPEERQETVKRFQELYSNRSAEMAALITAENGTPIAITTGLNVHGLSEQTAAYLRAAENLRWEEPLASGALLRREAVGVVAAVIPWNAPHQSALAKMVPALLAGATVVLKASPETAVDALALAEVFAEAGFPEGVVSVLPAGRETSEYLVAHPDVDKIAFTGSTAAGRTIASLAGEQLKRVSLELGGKSAAIVLEDADPAAVAEGLRFHSLGNNAESCQALTRILAPRSRYEEVVEAVKAMMESLTVGDPSDPATFIGPMVRADQQERVRSYIELGIAEGARLVTGGPQVPEGLEGGFYITPTLFADVDNSMRIAREEIFGPVLVVIPFDDENDAVRIANDSDYGLGGGVWSADRERALAVARRVRTGLMIVNGAMPSFDSPFGGFKASGVGREFGAVGLNQYIEHKTIAV
ncbi:MULTISPECIES: aldehyde dehydrogenase [unclassified Streptomyces]|uniref:aldehyde dehydrogenase n=1 Tax=unclassified Streptomyces TaxID=2593676 RepID=UPI002E75BE88|nr:MULTISPECIES: aldehyde dehydrogenase [unclassified Streptomyces]MEE1757893.1 aldehyde dehydrogenase [Streptomyces sp. SP18BB07]MEE1830434.1 aldehyde dehydrogenase [Streptomyces sp. SP17KL33]